MATDHINAAEEITERFREEAYQGSILVSVSPSPHDLLVSTRKENNHYLALPHPLMRICDVSDQEINLRYGDMEVTLKGEGLLRLYQWHQVRKLKAVRILSDTNEIEAAREAHFPIVTDVDVIDKRRPGA